MFKSFKLVSIKNVQCTYPVVSNAYLIFVLLVGSPQGAAFGFSSIAAQAGNQLAPFLPKLVPRLYRYQYDPSGPVRLAMSSIWNALVKDNKNVVS